MGHKIDKSFFKTLEIKVVDKDFYVVKSKKYFPINSILFGKYFPNIICVCIPQIGV